MPGKQTARAIAQRLNDIISHLVEADEQIDTREFDLWRGMAAGSQAQGSWQNTKGDRAEVIIKGILRHRLREKRWVYDEPGEEPHLRLVDGRTMAFADEPDDGRSQNQPKHRQLLVYCGRGIRQRNKA